MSAPEAPPLAAASHNVPTYGLGDRQHLPPAEALKNAQGNLSDCYRYLRRVQAQVDLHKTKAACLEAQRHVELIEMANEAGTRDQYQRDVDAYVKTIEDLLPVVHALSDALSQDAPEPAPERCVECNSFSDDYKRIDGVVYLLCMNGHEWMATVQTVKLEEEPGGVRVGE